MKQVGHWGKTLVAMILLACVGMFCIPSEFGYTVVERKLNNVTLVDTVPLKFEYETHARIGVIILLCILGYIAYRRKENVYCKIWIPLSKRVDVAIHEYELKPRITEAFEVVIAIYMEAKGLTEQNIKVYVPNSNKVYVKHNLKMPDNSKGYLDPDYWDKEDMFLFFQRIRDDIEEYVPDILPDWKKLELGAQIQYIAEVILLNNGQKVQFPVLPSIK
jgi:hypothetical protein